MTAHGHRRAYRVLLRLYPGWFQSLYAKQMEADFADLLATPGPGRDASVGAVRAWSVVLRDFLFSLPREWVSTARGNAPGTARDPRSSSETLMTVVGDLRHAVRTSGRAPGFVALVVLTLGVGIGVNVAMFSVADAVLFSPLPYDNPDRLAMVWNRHVATGADKVLISGPDFVDYRDRTSAFEDVVYIHNASALPLTGDDRAEQVDVGYVSANIFEFLGVRAEVGRTFGAADDVDAGAQMGQPGPAVISHALWMRRYGGDPGVVGRIIELGGRPAMVIGVLPADFELLLPYREGGAMSSGANVEPDIWRILSDRGFTTFPRRVAIVRMVGRLRPEVTLRQAQDELDAVGARLRDEHRIHEDRGTQIDLVPLHADLVGPVRTTILSLFGAVAVVLVLACANVANLISVRATKRRLEVAVRMALGADRRRVVRQLLTESAVLAAGGSLVGVGLAAVLIETIVSAAPANVPLLDRVALDGRAVVFAVVAGSLATMLFGLLPAFRASAGAPDVHLGTASRHGIGRGERVRAAIVTGEIALSLVLLAGGGLLVRSFVQLQRAQLGFESEGVLTAKVALGHGAYDDAPARIQYWETLRREAAQLPAVRQAGLVAPLPFGGQGSESPYSNTGATDANWGRYVATMAAATAGYFEAMGAFVLDGRTFEESDRGRRDIAVIDDIAANRLYPGERAVGRSVWVQTFGEEEPQPVEIIGVVRHIRHSNVIGDEREVLYRPASDAWTLALVLQTRGDPEQVIPALRNIAASLDPDVPLFDARPIAAYLADRNAMTRFTMSLASTFGLVALLMAAVGLYGVIAYAVEQRTNEIGLRMALGATPRRIVGHVLGHGGAMAAVGTVVGLAGALAVTRVIRSLLVEVPPNDPATFAAVALVLLFAALAAAWVPARRAARLDPLESLRGE